MTEIYAILFAFSLLSLVLGGYFFGLSEGLKKEKRVDVEFELKLGVILLGLGAVLVGFGL